jgi:hypothetical protein
MSEKDTTKYQSATVNSRTDKPYSALGKLMDSMARSHDVRGPYNIAHLVTAATGYRVTGQAVSRYFYGNSWPRPGFVSAFADALELTREERDALAWLYTYGPEQDGSP